MISNLPTNIEMNPASEEVWETRKTKVLLIAVNVAGYYSVSIRLLSLICAENDRLRERFDARFTELTTGEISTQFVDTIVAWSPALIGFSVNIWNRDEVFSLVRKFKACMPKVCILAGGQEVTGSCIDYLAQLPELDYVIDGEGEIPFQQFLDNWDAVQCRLRDPEKVSGLRFRDNGTPRLTRPGENVASLDDLPSPILAGLVPISEKQKLGVLLEGTRGCPFLCAFCFEGAKKGKVRSASVQRLIAEIDCMTAKGALYFHIMDPVLCIGDINRMEELTGHIKALLKSGKEVTFSVETYAEHITEKVAQCLKTCSIIDVGLQAIHEPTLKAIHRRYVPETFQAGLRQLREATASFNLYLICGLPFETLSSYFRGVRFVIESRPARIFLNELCLLNGTELRERADEYGYRFNPAPPYQVYENAWLGPFELKIAQSASKVVERHYNLSAEGLFVRYPWLAEKPVSSQERFFLPAPGSCSFQCPGCQYGNEKTVARQPKVNYDHFFGADVDLSAGDDADREEIIRMAGQLRLSGVARVRLIAPASLFGDADFIGRLLENGVWSFRTFIGFHAESGSSGPPSVKAYAADFSAAITNLCRTVQLKGRAVIRPFLEVVVQAVGFSSKVEMENCLSELAAHNVPLITVVPDTSQPEILQYQQITDLFKNRLSLRTWFRMPEMMIAKLLTEINQPEEVLDHLRWMDLVYKTPPLHPPCYG